MSFFKTARNKSNRQARRTWEVSKAVSSADLDGDLASDKLTNFRRLNAPVDGLAVGLPDILRSKRTPKLPGYPDRSYARQLARRLHTGSVSTLPPDRPKYATSLAKEAWLRAAVDRANDEVQGSQATLPAALKAGYHKVHSKVLRPLADADSELSRKVGRGILGRIGLGASKDPIHRLRKIDPKIDTAALKSVRAFIAAQPIMDALT